MADKNLKISVKSDLREGQKLTTFINDLQKRVEKFAKTLGNINIGGTGPGGQQKPGQAGLSKQLTDDKRAMEVMGREVDNLQRRFQNLGQTVNTTATKLRAATGTGLVDQYGRPLAPSGAAAPGGPALPGGPPGGIPGGPPPAAAGGGGFQIPPMLRSLIPALGAGWIAGQLKELILGAPTRDIGFATLRGEAQAGGMADMGRMGASMMRRDYTPALGLMNLAGKGFGATRFNPEDFAKIIQASPDQARNLAISKGLNWNVMKGTYEFARGMSPEMRASNMNALFGKTIQMAGNQDPMLQARIDYAQEQAGGRVGFARRYGRDFSAGAALGANVDPQQAMATVGAVLDVLGTGTNITKITRVVTEATRAGITSEAIQSMLRAQEIGGGDLMGRIYGSGLSRPMMGRAGMAAAGMAGQSLLRLSPETFAGGFTAGGPRSDELTMRKLEAGAGFLGQVTTGGLDEYQKTTNIALANKVGRSVYTVQTLANMPFNELLNAAMKGPTAEQKAAGITQPMAREQLNAVVGSLRNRAVTEAGVETPAGIQRLMGLGDDVAGGIEAMQRRGDRRGLTEVGTGLSLITNQPLGADIGGFLGGALAPGGRGGAPRETGSQFGAALALQYAGPKELEGDIKGMTLAMRDASAMVTTYSEVIKAFDESMRTTNPEMAQQAAMSLAGLGTAMGTIAEKGPGAVEVLKEVESFIDRMNERRANEQGGVPARHQIDWDTLP